MQGWIRLAPYLLSLGLAVGCAPDAGDLEPGACDDCGPGAGRTPPLGLASASASGKTEGGGPDRDAGRSGSLAEGILLARDDVDIDCDICDVRCVAAWDLCGDGGRYVCACAYLCDARCLKSMGGCGYNSEYLDDMIEYYEDEIDWAGIDCP